MLLPWRRKVMDMLSSDRVNKLFANASATWNALAKLERRMDDMSELMDGLKKEVAELRDAVVAIKSSVEQLRKAYEYLRDHPKVVEVVKDDPALADVITEIDGLTKDLADAVAKAGASGDA